VTYAPTNPDVVRVRPRTVACSAAMAAPYSQCRCWAEWKIKGQWAKYCTNHAKQRGMLAEVTL
jgi:hypothetical protein